MFENHIKSIKAHADEMASSMADFKREVLSLQEMAKQAEPAAKEYERLKDAMATAMSEYADVSKRLAEARAAYKELKDYISKN